MCYASGHEHKDNEGEINPGHGAGPSIHPSIPTPTALVTADKMGVDDTPAEGPSAEEPRPADTTEKED